VIFDRRLQRPASSKYERHSWTTASQFDRSAEGNHSIIKCFDHLFVGRKAYRALRQRAPEALPILQSQFWTINRKIIAGPRGSQSLGMPHKGDILRPSRHRAKERHREVILAIDLTSAGATLAFPRI
jgi:hypothetical protein